MSKSNKLALSGDKRIRHDRYMKEYIEGGYTLKDIALKHGLSVSYLKFYSDSERWPYLREQFLKVNPGIYSKEKLNEIKNYERASRWEDVVQLCSKVMKELVKMEVDLENAAPVLTMLDKVSSIYERANKGQRLEEGQPVELRKEIKEEYDGSRAPQVLNLINFEGDKNSSEEGKELIENNQVI